MTQVSGLPQQPKKRPIIQRAEAEPLVASSVRTSITNLKVTPTNQGFELSGFISDGSAITGSVDTPAYYIDASGTAKTEPIREDAASFFQRVRWKKAMRVQNITADPKGQALGDYLAWYVADKASKASISHIVAMHVVPKARNFYHRLGFEEYNKARPYSMLVDAKKVLDAEMKTTEASALSALGARQKELIDAMSDATLVIPVAALLIKARTNWEEKWRRTSEGNYERV